jgi:hypothetical protein
LGYSQWCRGNCIVWAPKHIVEQAKEAIVYVQGIADETSLDFGNHSKIILWYDKDRLVRCKNIFTICDRTLAWGRDGIIAHLVTSSFTLRSYPKSGFATREEGRVAQQLVMRQSHEWLKKHGLADGLVQQYAEWAGIQ